ncbi:MAG: DUF4369 domain-containing protein [Flavobacteriaceae bacterium]|nr:DUF4369 domain-containing protein [Flavobacteriaceae bacterium]
MRIFFGIITAVLFLTSCGNNVSGEGMIVTGKIDGLRKGKILLQKLEDTLFISVDSVIVDGNSEFEFSEEIKSPEVYYLTLQFQDSSNVVKRLPFFAENVQIDIISDLENYETAAKISGSTNQDKLNEYKELVRRYNDQNLELIESTLNAMKEGNDSVLTANELKQNRLMVSKYLATVNFAMNQKDYEVAPYLMLTEVYDAQVKYLDTVYRTLTPKIKDSKYGKALESFIESRKELD